MMLGLSIVKLSLCLYQKCCTLTTALCQYLPLRIFLEALCQYMYLWPSGTVPKYTSIPQWHCAKVYLYTLVALCHCLVLHVCIFSRWLCTFGCARLNTSHWLRAFECASLAVRKRSRATGCELLPECYWLRSIL